MRTYNEEIHEMVLFSLEERLLLCDILSKTDGPRAFPQFGFADRLDNTKKHLLLALTLY